MSELFDEVDEDLRREQLKKLWDRYSALIVAVAVLIVAAVGGWRSYQYWDSKRAAAAGSAFEAAVALSEQNKHAEAEAAEIRQALRQSGPGDRGGHRGLCLRGALPRLSGAGACLRHEAQGVTRGSCRVPRGSRVTL